jgi:hypothetical protein
LTCRRDWCACAPGASGLSVANTGVPCARFFFLLLGNSLLLEVTGKSGYRKIS